MVNMREKLSRLSEFAELFERLEFSLSGLRILMNFAGINLKLRAFRVLCDRINSCSRLIDFQSSSLTVNDSVYMKLIFNCAPDVFACAATLIYSFCPHAVAQIGL